MSHIEHSHSGNRNKKEMTQNRAISIIGGGIIINIISQLIFFWYTNAHSSIESIKQKVDKIEFEEAKKDLNIKIDSKVDKADFEKFWSTFDEKTTAFLKSLDDKQIRLESRIDNLYSKSK